ALSLIQTVPLTGAIVVSTPSDVALQDARKAIEMLRQMKVDVVGMVENMSYFVCPHCGQQTDIFSRGGAEKTAAQFGVAYLGDVQLIQIFGRRATLGSLRCLPAKMPYTPNRFMNSHGRSRHGWMRSNRARQKA